MDRPSGMSSSKRDPSDEESDEDDDDEDDEDAINFKQEDMIVSIEKAKINLNFYDLVPTRVKLEKMAQKPRKIAFY